MKFPHFIRSQKRLAGSHLRSNEMQWDFWTLNPESAHQVTWLMGDRGLPRSWRHMNGYGSHTYMWVNAAGEKTWVKFHFKTDQGAEILTEEEAAAIRGENPDYHIEDLYKAIGAGEHPTWTVKVQVMPYEDAASYRFNPFDLTKVWPHSDYPEIPIGKLTLNRNPDNYFAQIEQAAFEPSALVPGIGFSPDKMLLGRVFAYADTHRYRIGPNYHQLPVNQPKVPVNTYTFDGPMAYHHQGDAPVYAPNTKGRGFADETRAGPDRLGGRRGDGAPGLRAARRGRRLRAARHAGARGHGRRRPGPADRQHHRPRLAGRVGADAAAGVRLLAQRRQERRRRGGRELRQVIPPHC